MAPDDTESINGALQGTDEEGIGLERLSVYLQSAKAKVVVSRARVANAVALILVLAVVLSLPLSVWAVSRFPVEQASLLRDIFDRWYDIVGPILGAAVGALFGFACAGRGRE